MVTWAWRNCSSSWSPSLNTATASSSRPSSSARTPSVYSAVRRSYRPGTVCIGRSLIAETIAQSDPEEKPPGRLRVWSRQGLSLPGPAPGHCFRACLAPLIRRDTPSACSSGFASSARGSRSCATIRGMAQPDVRSQVGDIEWKLRVDLAAAYRLVALYGWDDLIFTHISARLPGPARDDAKCVLPTHSINGVAVSAQKGGVLPLSQQSTFVLSSLAYHDYEGLALNPEEKPRLVRDLGDKHFLMLRNHGLLTVGDSVADAWVEMYLFEATCMIQVRAQAGAGSGELVSIDPRIIAGSMAMRQNASQGVGPGALAWPALLRKLDRIDPSFRT